MESWLEMDKDVSELLENWRWEEARQYDGKYELDYSNQLKNKETYDPQYYNYSYSEWRKCRSYYKTSTDNYYKDFITTLMPLRHGDNPSLHPNTESQNTIYSTISRCISANIPCTHLLIGILYSSYHLVSPYILPTLKYLLTTYKNDINFTVTSISNPRYTVAHIGAMSNDVELLQILYDLGGDINVIDGSNFSPLYISLGKSNFKAAHCLLWMNAVINEKKTIRKLSNFGLRHLMNVVACLQHFLFEIEIYLNAVYKALQLNSNSNSKIDIHNDIIQSILTFVLPVQSYQSIKRLLKQFEKNEINDIKIPFSIVIEEAKKCLSSLIVLKKQLMSTQKTIENENEMDKLYPFGQIDDKNNNQSFVNRMILCNLFELSMSDGDLYNTAKWRKRIKSILCKPKKISMFHRINEEENLQNIVALKWVLVGTAIIATTAIVIKQIANRQ